MSRARAIAVVVAAAVAVTGATLAVTGRSRGYDRGFDTRVEQPAHAAPGPVVLFDEGHLNTHTSDGAYQPFVELLGNDGCAVRVSQEPFSAAALAGVAVLVVALPRGANDANDAPAFAEGEIAAVEAWVRDGGALLLVTDHWPYGPAAAALAGRFGVAMGGGLVEDPAHHDPDRGESHLVFTADGGLLLDHPIVRGRGESERVRRVLTFTGQSLAGPPDAVPFLALSEHAVERPPAPPRVDKSGGDVRVTMEYGEPIPAAGRAQAIALEFGRGRIVVLGEAGMLRAHRDRDGRPLGMNAPGADNRQLALNVVRWLTRAL